MSNSKTPTNNSSKAATSMAELLKKSTTALPSFKKGEIIEGVITKLTSGEILVDINAKAEAVVLEKEKRLLNSLLSSLKVGDRVKVQILNPESDMGYPVVSLRRFLDEAVWKKLDELKNKKEVIEVVVDEATKGGFLVSSKDGMSGFLPNSHVTFKDDPQSLVGSRVKVVVFELDRAAHRVVFSQKHTVTSSDFEKEVSSLKPGQKVKAKITNIAPFGVFVLLTADGKTVEGFIHISEVSWENVADLNVLYKPGEEVEASVIGIDKEARRINLSVKRLKEDPFDRLSVNYPVDKKVTAEVSNVINTGVVVILEDGISGIIKKEKIPPTVSFKAGDSVDAVVSGIDKRARRILLVPVLQAKPIGYR